MDSDFRDLQLLWEFEAWSVIVEDRYLSTHTVGSGFGLHVPAILTRDRLQETPQHALDVDLLLLAFAFYVYNQ